MKAMRIAAVLLGVWALAACARADDFLFAHFPMDGDLQDASGKGHHAAGQARFAEGRAGQALKLNGEQVQVPDSPELRLAPGLTIDCWVYFDDPPSGYQPLVIKGNSGRQGTWSASTSRGSRPADRGRAGAGLSALGCHNAAARWPPTLPTRTRCC